MLMFERGEPWMDASRRVRPDHGATTSGIAPCRVLKINEAEVPTECIREVAGTPPHFRTATAVGSRIGQDDPRLTFADGHDFIEIPHMTELRLHARVEEATSGRGLEVLSDEPGLQFHSGAFLEGKAPRDVGRHDLCVPLCFPL